MYSLSRISTFILLSNIPNFPCECPSECNFEQIRINRLKYGSIRQHLSRLMGKPTICIGENKDADQLRGNCEADQRLCFRYSDSTIPLLLKFEISSF